jgi:acetyl esterase
MRDLADPELTTFIADFNALNLPSAAETGPDALRAGALERVRSRPEGPELHSVDDVTLGSHGLTVRVYRPRLDRSGVVVYFHGGGWVIGDLDTHDRACRRLADSSGVVVVAVDYRRAPEHPWPAAVADGIAVVEWIATEPDVLGDLNGRVGVAGDSAGGLLAALVSHRLRDDSPDLLPVAQFLIYANTDLASSGGSMDSEAHGFGLDVADIEWFYRQWVPDTTRWSDPHVSPLHADSFAGLPATFVVACEHDPLRDQSEEYARRTDVAGVPTTVRREPGMVHNFMLWDLASPACAAAADRVAADMATALAN